MKRQMYQQVRRLFDQVGDAFSDGFDALEEDFGSLGTGVETSVQVKSEADLTRTKAKIDYMFKTSVVDTMAKTAAKLATLPERSNASCHLITVAQFTQVMKQFSDIISNNIMSGFVAAGRGPGQNYNGPAYAKLNIMMTCGINPNDPVTGNANGLPACVASETPVASNPTGATLTDAGMDVGTLDPEQSVLTMPQLVTRTDTFPDGTTREVRIPQARPGNLKQQLWIAARDFCTRAMGPHPTPPNSAALSTPEGMIKSEADARCTGRTMAFAKPCADRIAFITRPDCDDPAFAPLCEQARNVCTTARAFNVILPARFENCEHGLSAYETEYISQLLCDGSGPYINTKSQHAKNGEMDKIMRLCAARQSRWREKVALERDVFTKGMAGLYDVRQCWGRAN